jgi:hypothetical protein
MADYHSVILGSQKRASDQLTQPDHSLKTTLIYLNLTVPFGHTGLSHEHPQTSNVKATMKMESGSKRLINGSKSGNHMNSVGLDSAAHQGVPVAIEANRAPDSSLIGHSRQVR